MLRKAVPAYSRVAPKAALSRFFSTSEENKKAAFGFKTVDESIKQSLVNGVFHNVASKYDIMNDVMSAGIHRLWKDQFVRTLDAAIVAPGKDTFKVLDVAGGTGDISFRIQDAAKERRALSGTPEHKLPELTICDINESMLEQGEIRAKSEGRHDIKFKVGNGEALPFEDNTFDAVTIAFGIRNFTHVDKGLKEFYRVLKPGGRLLVLEFSKVETPLVKDFYEFYSFQVIPPMGQLVAGDAESYQYLVESIRKFPSQEQFASMIYDAGFRHVGYTNMTFGVVAMHSGFKLPKQ